MTDTAEWTGRVGQVWAQRWRDTDRAFAPLTRRLLAALAGIAPTAGRALDIGCGAGETAIALAGLRPHLDIVGADVSADLIAVARARATAATPRFVTTDAIEAAAALAPVDLMLSRHGVMFFDDPAAAFGRLRAAASAGAHLVFTCFRDWSLNRFASDFGPILGEGPPSPDQPGPFAFADEQRVRAMLVAAGWGDVRGEPVDYPFRVGEGADAVAEAVAFLGQIGPVARALRDASAAQHTDLVAALTEICRTRCAAGAVDFPAAAWLWTAAAPRKGPS